MQIASISKTFTAMAVLKLWQDGKLNIEDEFSKYFPAFNYPGITVRCLLNHRSGLPNYNYFMETLGWDKSSFVSNKDVLNYLITRKADLPDVLTPNTHFSYCNTNYALLALLIEKISGLSYAAYLNRTFFAPLQMKNSFVFSLADTANTIPSYNWRGAPEAYNFLDQVYGDKNVCTTPRDLLIWDRALSSDLIFTAETLAQAYAPYSNEKPGLRNYGLGWRMNIFPDGSKIIYHNGWWHGSNAAFIRLLKEKATIIVIGNKFTRAIYYAKVLTSLFGNYYLPVEEEESFTAKDSVKLLAQPIKVDTLKTPDSKKLKKLTEEKKDSADEKHKMPI
jgi:CubicO group peptidase (beta-lactamase class C family)